MKIIKLLFNRFTFIALAIILQMGLYTILALGLSSYYYAISIALRVVSLFVIIRVINRDINPGQQILWVTVIAIFPIAGLMLYLMIGDAKWSSRSKERMRRSFYKQIPVVNKTENLPERYAGQINYITTKTPTNAFAGCATEYFPTGEKFFASLKKDLASAKKFIFLEYFIISSGSMWNEIEEILLKKVDEGVEVRVMYDDIGSMKNLKNNFDSQERKKGINCIKFNKFRPFVTNLHNNRDHRKIAVIDGKIGYTGGINLADEYINADGRDYHWKDCGVRIYGNAVNEFTEQFMQLFEIASRKHINFEQYSCNEVINTGEKGLVVPFGAGPYFFYKCPVAEEVFLNMISQARKEIIITTPYLILDYSLNRALVSAAARGVDVKIAIPDVPDKKIIYLITRNNALYLQNNGVKIYRAKGSFLHSKSIVADGEVAVVGTINFDYRSLIHHFENAVWMYDTVALKELLEDVNGICSSANEYGSDLDMGFFARLFATLCKLFTPLF